MHVYVYCSPIFDNNSWKISKILNKFNKKYKNFIFIFSETLIKT